MTDLLETVADGVVTLTLNRPERLNALSPDIISGLHETLRRLGADPDARCIVLTGTGRAFCAGGDIKTMETRATRPYEKRLEELRHAHELPLLLRTIPKVVIASINGPAFGAGLAMALACDFRIATRTARLGTAFGKVGYAGDWGGSWTMTRLVGTAKARELYILGDEINGDEAARIGLVNRAVNEEALAGETLAMASRIAQGPSVAYGYMKRNLFAAETGSFAEVLELEAMHQVRTQGTSDHAEARAAFLEKRKPKFSGQ